MAHVRRLRVTKLFQKTGSRFPSLKERIAEQLMLRRPVMIIITGKAQTGKTTLGRFIASLYDTKYKIFFTVKELLEYLEELRSKLIRNPDGTVSLPEEYKNKFVVYDEPQAEFGRRDIYDERTKVMITYTSMYGFLKQGLIFCMPNIKNLSDIIMTNITLRIDVSSKLNANKEIVRKAYVKIPFFNENKNKFMWLTVQEFLIPFIADDQVYDSRKTINFFDVQLQKWQDKIGLVKPWALEAKKEEKAAEAAI